MEIFEKLCRDYAQNRNEYKRVCQKIKNMFPNYCDEEGFMTDEEWRKYEVDLSRFREWWQENDGMWWRGWVGAIEEFGDGSTERELELAKYLDEKRRLKKELGIIKRRICAHGKSSLKNTQ